MEIWSSGLGNPSGLWSDGTTMWVSTSSRDIFAYNLSTKPRDSVKDSGTLVAAGNTQPEGLWSDGTTMWVSDSGAVKIFAYNLSTKARDSAKDFNSISDTLLGPNGLWSDGTTMWVSDRTAVYAFNFSTQARDSSRDFSFSGHSNTRGIWSNGTTMWASDVVFDTLFAYTIPVPSMDASLSALSVDGRSIVPNFATGTTAYTLSVPNAISQISVAATATDDDATLSGTGVRSLNVGANNIDIVVTAEDSTTTQTYNIVVTRAAPPSAVATLSALSITGQTITPSFTPGTRAYSASVAHDVSSVTVAATSTDDGACLLYTSPSPRDS